MEIDNRLEKYDPSRYTVYQMLDQKLESVANEVKQREAFLKTVPAKGMIITDELSGETFTVYPPAKSSSTSIAVTLK